MVKEFTDDFTVYVQLSVCNSAIIRELLNGWSDEISSTLDNAGASEWKTKDMDLSDIKTEVTDVLGSKIFNPISSFMSKTGKDMLNIYDLMDVKEDGTYRFIGYRELFSRWLTINFCMSKDNDQSKPEFTVFTALSGITSPKLYIGTIDGVFFWVFKGKEGLKEGQACNSDRTNHITLELSHLTSVDFSSKPDKLIYALLTQAMEQTNKVEDIASFLLNPEINKQLGQKTRWLRLILSNQLTDKLAHNDREFKSKLCECIGSKVDRSNKKSISKEALVWLKDTLLLEPVLLKLQELEINITPITQSLTVDDIRYFSIEGITQFLTPKHCSKLFREALTLNRRAVVLSLLLTEHCDQLVKLLGNKNVPPLFFFTNYGVSSGVKYLLRKGLVDVNAKDINGNTALTITAQKGYTECLNVLLVWGAQVDVKNKISCTPLHFAAYRGHTECLNVLLAWGSRVNMKSRTGHIPLHGASEKGHTEIVKTLLAWGSQVNSQNAHGDTALHVAAYKGYVGMLNALLTVEDIQVNVQNQVGSTPIYYAAQRGHTECINVLLAKGVVLNLKDNQYGNTPLHRAALEGHAEIVKALLSAGGIQVDVENNDGNRALHLAAYKGHIECFKVLLVWGSQVNLKNKYGNTPLHFSTYQGHAEIVNALLAVKGIHVDVQNRKGSTPLHCAAKTNQAEIVRALLSVCAIHQVMITDVNGDTALHLAIKRGHKECLNVLQGVEGLVLNQQDLLAIQRLNCLR